MSLGLSKIEPAAPAHPPQESHATTLIAITSLLALTSRIGLYLWKPEPLSSLDYTILAGLGTALAASLINDHLSSPTAQKTSTLASRFFHGIRDRLCPKKPPISAEQAAADLEFRALVGAILAGPYEASKQEFDVKSPFPCPPPEWKKII